MFVCKRSPLLTYHDQQNFPLKAQKHNLWRNKFMKSTTTTREKLRLSRCPSSLTYLHFSTIHRIKYVILLHFHGDKETTARCTPLKPHVTGKYRMRTLPPRPLHAFVACAYEQGRFLFLWWPPNLEYFSTWNLMRCFKKCTYVFI
jgi:hypothetical protein